MDVNGYLKAEYDRWIELFHKWDPENRYFIAPRAKCADGFEISVQASAHHYCAPKENGAFPYLSVEVGYPSEKEEDLMDYIMMNYLEEKPAGTPTNSVYPFVPVETVNRVLAKHGWIVGRA